MSIPKNNKTPTVAEIEAALVATGGNRAQAADLLGRAHSYVIGRAYNDPAVKRLLERYPVTRCGPPAEPRPPQENQCPRCGAVLTHPRVPAVGGQQLCAWCLWDARQERPRWLAQRRREAQAATD